MARSNAIRSSLSPEPVLASPRLGPWIVRILRMHRAWRTRQELLALDAHLLRDIGLTKQEARAEAARLPWDSPSTW